MSIATERIVVVDYKIPKQLKPITFLQYDTNIIKFVVENNGEPADLSNITNIVVNFRRKDKKVISQVLTAVGNEITYRLTDSEMLKPGDGELVLQLYDDEERLSIARFKVKIDENIESGEAPTVEEVRLVQQLIDRVNERMEELSQIERGAQGPKGDPGERGPAGPPGPPGENAESDERLDIFLHEAILPEKISSSSGILSNQATTSVVDSDTIDVTVNGSNGGHVGFSMPYNSQKRFMAVYKITNTGSVNIGSIRARVDYRSGANGVTQELGSQLLTPTTAIPIGGSHEGTLIFVHEKEKLRTHAGFMFYSPNNNVSFRLELKIYDITNMTDEQISNINWREMTAPPILVSDKSIISNLAKDLEFKGSTWRGKTWLTIGDSVTASGIYQNMVGSALGFGTIINKGISGASVINMLNGITELELQSADLITLYGCFNNFNEGAPVLGNLSDAPNGVSGASTFIASLKYVIEYVLTKNPESTFVLIATHNGTDDLRPDLYQPINGTHNIGDYTEAMGKVARHYGLPFIDMYGKSGINSFNSNQYTTDGLHLTPAGYRRVASIMVGELQRIEPIQ